MLQSMRQLAHSWVFKGLMLLLVVSFGIWGIGDMFRGNALRRAVAKAGDESISMQELNRAFEQSLARARQVLGPDITAQQAKQMGMADRALNDLIENSLFDQDLKRLGIEAGDSAVFQQLMQMPQMKDKDGKFDKRILAAYLQQSGLGERSFLDQQRKTLASRQLLDALSTLPPLPTSMVKALYCARGQKRVFDVITLEDSSIKGIGTPDDAALRDYYQQNPKLFTTAESRGLTIATLATADILKDITVSDDQVKKEYDNKRDQLTEPEKRDLLQVVLQDEAKAKEVAESARASGNLVAAAKPTGREVIPLNQTEESGLFPELAKPVFALKQGGVTDPIKSALGWHVMQVRKITPAGIPSLDAIKDKLRETMKNDQAADIATRQVNQLDDELAAGHALEDIAGEMKLHVVKIPAVDASGKTPDDKEPAELPHKDDVLKQAFGQNSGETSPVMDDKNGNYFVVRTDKISPSAVKSFDDVKPEVAAAWKAQEQVKRASAEAEDIAKGLREGKAASVFAAKAGVDVRVSKPISLLGDSDPALPKEILAQIMKLKKGEATVLPLNGKQMIVRLAQIVSVGDTVDPAAAGKISSELTNDATKGFADEYGKYLRVLFPVVIHQDALDGIAQQGG